jgi:hypothetical protein
MENTELIQLVNEEMAIDLPEKISFNEIRDKLSEYINNLIVNDFQKLVALLYRIDISEPRLKKLLEEENHEDAGKVIADLIIERQLQKIKSRQQFKQKSEDIDDTERW